MQHSISRSIRIHRYIVINLLCAWPLLYSMETPYAQMPSAPAQSVRIPVVAAPDDLLVSAAGPLGRSASHGHFQSGKKKHKKTKHMNQASAGQRHDNSANTINDFSINVATVRPEAVFAKKTSWGSKLRGSASILMLAGLSAVIYLQVRITNQAQQIAANTGSLDVTGDQIANGAQQIAGAIKALDDIMQQLLNLTRKG